MTAEDVSNESQARTERCSLVILHESGEALEHAESLCDRIISEMWAELDMEIHRWPFTVLASDPTSDEAARKAALADVVVVAATSGNEFSQEFLAWADRFVDLRQKREGALVGLIPSGKGKSGGTPSQDVQLHHLALRAGMDYLNHLPNSPHGSIPDLTEWCASRAETFTGTLTEIIRSDPPPKGV